jgi:hypothetical protein
MQSSVAPDWDLNQELRALFRKKFDLEKNLIQLETRE